MEDEPCQFSKYGFCKFRDTCKRKHYSEECKDLSNCRQIKTCNKRHPKPCQRYTSGRCKFQSDCAYNHQNVAKTKEKCELTERVELLEKIVVEITLKFIKVDQELKNVKEETKVQNFAGNSEPDNMRENEPLVEKELSKSDTNDTSSALGGELTEKLKTMEPELHEAGIKAVEANAKQTEGKTSEFKGDLLKCKKCEYTCKKDVTLRKHFNTKHENHNCAKCDLRFDNISDLQKHGSEDHIIGVKETTENKTNKMVEQDNGDNMKQYDDRCSKCGYILFAENTTEDNGKLKLVCKLCPILDQRQQI